ncbi:MobP1 family relaxase [Pseudomonas amygdali pv. morsprunorum]|uniref:MobP1 family relaxase n=1 Tax=Pseudomonas amygdali TaxID=47877 RepID=UPI00289057C8|nr:MobP1 family relaxase [Pseudomonas amygdali]MDT3268721.1 MobP1 family relaxase [Pseudomonas amygdali pv. morsprunorum]
MGVKIDEEWRIKRARGEKASKSAFAFKINQHKKSGAIRRLPSKEMMVKITGSASTAGGIKNAIDYMSHEGELNLYDDEGNEWNGKEGISELKEYIVNSGAIVPTAKADEDVSKLKKQTLNIVFSPPPSEKVSRQHLFDTVRETLKESYPDNAFVMAYHDNTKKPHVHVVLKVSNKSGQRIDIRKKDIRQLRTSMSLKLQGLGYNVKATHKRDFKLDQESERTRNLCEVVEFGTANYQFDKNNKRQNYIIYKTIDGQKEVTVWGKTLLREIERENVEVGHMIKLKKEGAVEVIVPTYDENGAVQGHKTVKRNEWKIENTSVAGLDRTMAKAQKLAEPEQALNLHTPERQKKQMKAKLEFNEVKNEVLQPKIKLGPRLKI